MAPRLENRSWLTLCIALMSTLSQMNFAALTAPVL